MSDTLDDVRAAAQAAITHPEDYIPRRYPWTYSADFLRDHTHVVPEEWRGDLEEARSRSSASQATNRWAQALGVETVELARIFADCYLTEHGIPLGMANTERAGGGSGV